MKKYWPFFVVALLSALPVFAQQPAAAPSPTPSDDKDVVRISTNLIQVDVSVTDKKGNTVRDLKPEEVEIYENGKLQKVSAFSFVPGAVTVKPPDRTSPTSIENKASLSMPPGPPVRPESVRRTIAVVVDDLNLSFGSMVWVREALKKFINEQVREGDLVAIIRTGAGVGALQQFTTDRRQLLAAAERVKYNAAGNAGYAFFNPVTESITNRIVTAEGVGASPPPEFTIDGTATAPDMQDMALRFNEFRENIFASGTLGALNFIVRGMRELPGRKSIVFLSDGLNLVTRDETGRPETSRIFTAMRHLIDLANRASVVFYTIHAAGQQVPGFNAEDDVSGVARMGGEELTTKLMAAQINKINDSQDGLRYLADETGGLAYLNLNDISTGFRRALDDQSYYLVAYEPDGDTFNANESRFNKFEVKVNRPGVTVRHRSGFFGFSEEQIVKPKLTATATIVNALTSPFAVKDIGVRMNALYTNDEKEGAQIRAFLNVNGADLKFTDLGDGVRKTTFDLVAFTFGDNGTVIDERSKTMMIYLNAEEYKRFLERGLVSMFSLPVKKPGGYQVRLAIRDQVSERVGSANQYVEIPDLKKGALSLSGMALENTAAGAYRRTSSASGPSAENSDPQWYTAVRQFRAGSILRFGYQIYNAKVDASRKPDLTYHLRLLYQGQPIYEGVTSPIPRLTVESANTFSTTGALQLGQNLVPGDYILEVDVIDRLGKAGRGMATQFVQFEIVE